MDQLELNNIAKLFVHTQSLEVANKLSAILTDDVKERVKRVPGPAVHHMHNMSLFYAMVRINCLYQAEDNSEAASRQYVERAEALKSRFFDIVDALKDFEPSGKKSDNPTDE